MVELASGSVIGFGGGDFAIEVAEVVGFVVAGYLGLPFFLCLLCILCFFVAKTKSVKSACPVR